jgi:hypothetical protein
VRYTTAVGRLRTVASDLSAQAEWRDSLIVRAYVYGELLDALPKLEWISLALVVDLPAERSRGWRIRLHRKRRSPFLDSTSIRLAGVGVLWLGRCGTTRSSDLYGSGPWKEGADESTLDALADRRLDHLERSVPSEEETFVAQLRIERNAARKHLESVVDSYHDRDWRKSHKGFGVYPEDHLWWVTKGLLDLDNAIGKV